VAFFGIDEPSDVDLFQLQTAVGWMQPCPRCWTCLFAPIIPFPHGISAQVGAGLHVGPDQTVASFVAFCLQGAVMPAMNLRAASTCKVATQGKDPNMSGTALSSENPGGIALPWSNVTGMMTSWRH